MQVMIRKAHPERLRGRGQTINKHNSMCCFHSEALGTVERGKNEPSGHLCAVNQTLQATTPMMAE